MVIYQNKKITLSSLHKVDVKEERIIPQTGIFFKKEKSLFIELTEQTEQIVEEWIF
jgi:hypothetical protein